MHIAAAVIPGTHGRPSDREQASVVVARVTSRESSGALTLDADLGAVPAHLDEVRMIGRASTRRIRPFEIGGVTVTLPEDLAVGDLVAVPCAGSVCCRQLRAAVAS
ncbi:hypothetical protein [Herbiconiux sp.]|uniref:hypothetical protein n=1 Tax=Herbiconiux sp. TaxID=1871186 RepID=UPI0025B9B3B8|nr:hypothetical protein [Herbiconiux sp.]